VNTNIVRPYVAFSIGTVVVSNPLILAPMEDVTNAAFRLIAKRIANPGLMFTEFVSAQAVKHAIHRTLPKMRLLADERPIGIQIFGAEPEVMAETARVAESMAPDIIDINMGCWVPKVCRQGAGAALLKDPDLAESIVRAVVRAVKVPVTVKVRAGWDYSLFAAPELARRFEGVGAKAITVHARYAKQGFDGEADWNLIGEVKQAVGVPVIGNGDVKTPEDAVRMLAMTGCDGVMVGRAAIGNPWALGAIGAHLRGETRMELPAFEERAAVAVEHLRLQVASFEADDIRQGDNAPGFEPETRAVKSLRGQLPLYLKGIKGAAHFRAELSQCSSIADVEDVFARAAGQERI